MNHEGKDPRLVPCMGPQGCAWQQGRNGQVWGRRSSYESSRGNGKLEREKVPRCDQGQALRAGAKGQPVTDRLNRMASLHSQRVAVTEGGVQVPWDTQEGFPEERA